MNISHILFQALVPGAGGGMKSGESEAGGAAGTDMTSPFQQLFAGMIGDAAGSAVVTAEAAVSQTPQPGQPMAAAPSSPPEQPTPARVLERLIRILERAAAATAQGVPPDTPSVALPEATAPNPPVLAATVPVNAPTGATEPSVPVASATEAVPVPVAPIVAALERLVRILEQAAPAPAQDVPPRETPLAHPEALVLNRPVLAAKQAQAPSPAGDAAGQSGAEAEADVPAPLAAAPLAAAIGRLIRVLEEATAAETPPQPGLAAKRAQPKSPAGDAAEQPGAEAQAAVLASLVAAPLAAVSGQLEQAPEEAPEEATAAEMPPQPVLAAKRAQAPSPAGNAAGQPGAEAQTDVPTSRAAAPITAMIGQLAQALETAMAVALPPQTVLAAKQAQPPSPAGDAAEQPGAEVQTAVPAALAAAPLTVVVEQLVRELEAAVVQEPGGSPVGHPAGVPQPVPKAGGAFGQQAGVKQGQGVVPGVPVLQNGGLKPSPEVSGTNAAVTPQGLPQQAPSSLLTSAAATIIPTVNAPQPTPLDTPLPKPPVISVQAVDQPKTEPTAAELKASGQKASEPKASESKASESKASEPKASEPKASESKASEPKASEQKASELKLPEPKASPGEGADPVPVPAGAVTRLVVSEGVMYRANQHVALPSEQHLAARNSATVAERIDPSRIEIAILEAPASDAPSSGQEESGGLLNDQQQKPAEQNLLTPPAGHVAQTDAPAFQNMEEPGPVSDKPITHERIMGQIKEHLASRREVSDNGQISMRLHPEALGELKIQMSMEDQRLKVEIMADSRVVKEALLQNLDTLKETLSRQNIVMERFSVTTGGGSLLQQSFREGRKSEQSRQARHYGRADEEENTIEQVQGYLNTRETRLLNLVL